MDEPVKAPTKRGRPKMTTGKKHKGRSVTLHPDMMRWARVKAVQLDRTFSSYVAKLIEMDQAQELINLPKGRS